MARGINKVILVGHLGRDPEVRYAAGGGAVANITLATSEGWKDKQTGEMQERTEWHRVVMFGRLGEIAGEYLRKGSQVYIEGRLQTRKWQGQDGQDRYTTEIVASDMQMLGGRGTGGGTDAEFNPDRQDRQGTVSREPVAAQSSGASAPVGQQPASPGQDSRAGNYDGFDDDIPF